jgi:hypothetical protein
MREAGACEPALVDEREAGGPLLPGLRNERHLLVAELGEGSKVFG